MRIITRGPRGLLPGRSPSPPEPSTIASTSLKATS